MYVTNFGNDTVSQANLNGTGVAVFTLAGTLNKPTGIALDVAAGKMYVANVDGATVSQANLDGTGGVSLGNLANTLDDPTGIALALPAPVGGHTVPVSKVGLLAPWLGLAAISVLVALRVMLVRRRGESLNR